MNLFVITCMIAILFHPSYGHAATRCASDDLVDLITRLKKQKYEPLTIKECGALEPVSASRFFSRELNLPEETIVVWNFDELRYLPHALPGGQILLLAPRLDLNIERIHVVETVAKTMKISIHLLLINQPDKAGNEAKKALMELSKSTGGKVFALRLLKKVTYHGLVMPNSMLHRSQNDPIHRGGIFPSILISL